MTPADRTARRASGGVLFRLWLARLRIRRALVLHRIARLLVWVVKTLVVAWRAV